jgi:D-alanyl-lipoteichoic acid acyltransferase DltB (MBOAT superfamily)
MTIQSYSYLIALPLVWLIVWAIRTPRPRIVGLLLASYMFYASWGLAFLLVLLVSTTVNYSWGQVLRKRPMAPLLWAGIGFNLAILAVFKYLPSIGSGILGGSSFGRLVGTIVMPVGLSFWTFQALSYLMDIYRGEEEKPSLLEFCLYMAFWPTVLSGPVMRVGELVPQFRSDARPGWEDVTCGLHRLLVGLFMKVVLAQVLAVGLYKGEGVSDGFDKIAGGWGGLDVLLLAVSFGFQLYFDFAGYSNMAIGAARLFGIRLVENFDRSFFSRTPSEFWSRWHMSLSFCIRDYVFMPLASRRRSLWWRNLSLVTSMTIFGLWHAASWPLVAWGLYQGVLLVAHRQVQQLRRRWQFSVPPTIDTLVSWSVTFVLIAVGWVLFRSHDMSQALGMLRALLLPGRYLQLGLRPDFYIIATLVIGLYFVYSGLEWLVTRFRSNGVIYHSIRLLSPAYYAALILLVLIWSKQQSVFVYFQF